MNNRLLHDVAIAMATQLVEMVALREEQRADAFDAFYEVSKAGLESYAMQSERMLQRLKPLKN